jgi:hypothetical protein
MDAIIKLGAGDFIGCTLFRGLGGDFASARSRVEAVALTLWAKLTEENRDSAATATKVLMDFMVVFLNLVSDKGLVALM